MLTAPGRMIDLSTIKAMNLRKAVLDGIVERTLLVQDAERLGITISEDELDNELVAGRAHVSLPVDRAPLGGRWASSTTRSRMLPVINHETKQFDYKAYDRVVRQFPTAARPNSRSCSVRSSSRPVCAIWFALGCGSATTRRSPATSARSRRPPFASLLSVAIGSLTTCSTCRPRPSMPG